MRNDVRQLLRHWLGRALSEPDGRWLDERRAMLTQGRTRDLHILIGLAPRRLGKSELPLTDADLADADRARRGWNPRRLRVDEAARSLALLDFAETTDDFAAVFADLCAAADVGEAVALYRGLPLYPALPDLDWQIGEGLRTSMRAVFEAIAHNSPVPRERFSQDRWNHMILKALFVGAALHPIQGLDDRGNAELATILGDYAHERWAAGRAVTPELWRCVGPFATGALLDDLARLAVSPDDTDRAAAALALSDSPDAGAAAILAMLPDQTRLIREGRLSWPILAARECAS